MDAVYSRGTYAFSKNWSVWFLIDGLHVYNPHDKENKYYPETSDMSSMFQPASLKCCSEKEHLKNHFAVFQHQRLARVWWCSFECLIFCKPAELSFSCLFSGCCDVSRWAGLYKALNNGSLDLRHRRDCGVFHITKDKKSLSPRPLRQVPSSTLFFSVGKPEMEAFSRPTAGWLTVQWLKMVELDRVPQVYHRSGTG